MVLEVGHSLKGLSTTTDSPKIYSLSTTIDASKIYISDSRSSTSVWKTEAHKFILTFEKKTFP